MTGSDNHKGDRIAKVIARAGVCSRRDAEKLIDQGVVQVNGHTINTPATKVSTNDKIIVNGKPISQSSAARVFLYHKPAGLVTTHKDEKNRQTVFESLPANMPRVVSVGRLDLNTEGLLILTTDGSLSRYMELPATGWKRQYRVRVFGYLDTARLDSLSKGITIDGVRYKPIHATVEKEGKNSWIHITITEGKNREVRKVMDHLGLQVSRLIRTDYGPFTLGSIKQGAVEEVSQKMINKTFPKNLAKQ